MRALFVAMDKWVQEGAAPPPSRIPHLSDGTLTKAADVAFPELPGVQSPKTLTAGSRTGNPFVTGGAGAGSPLPLLVPQVDADGNERAGIRLPEVAVPLATYTGWNFRSAATGGTNQLVPLLGSYIPLATDESGTRSAPRPAAVYRGAVHVAPAVPRRDQQVRRRAGQRGIPSGRRRAERRQAGDRALGVRDA